MQREYGNEYYKMLYSYAKKGVDLYEKNGAKWVTWAESNQARQEDGRRIIHFWVIGLWVIGPRLVVWTVDRPNFEG